MLNIPVIASSQYADISTSTWKPKHKILEVSLDATYQFIRKHVVVQAPNIEQIVFGLSSDESLKSFEVIGATFRVLHTLEAALPARKGCVSFKTGPDANLLGVGTSHVSVAYDAVARDLQFFRNMERTVFCVRFRELNVDEIVYSCPNMSIGISTGFLSSVWVFNPEVLS